IQLVVDFPSVCFLRRQRGPGARARATTKYAEWTESYFRWQVAQLRHKRVCVRIDLFRLPWRGAQNARDPQNEGDGARGTYPKVDRVISHVQQLVGQSTPTVAGAGFDTCLLTLPRHPPFSR